MLTLFLFANIYGVLFLIFNIWLYNRIIMQQLKRENVKLALFCWANHSYYFEGL